MHVIQIHYRHGKVTSYLCTVQKQDAQYSCCSTCQCLQHPPRSTPPVPSPSLHSLPNRVQPPSTPSCPHLLTFLDGRLLQMSLLHAMRSRTAGLFLHSRPQRSAVLGLRPLSDSAPSAVEQELEEKLLSSLPSSKVVVRDMSGGCGTMYKIDVESDSFQGLGTVKQHQLVTKILKEEIPNWHGFTLNTSVPK